MVKIENLLELLAKHGGSIISSNDLHSDLIAQARASNRMYVDENSLGYIWEPPFAGRFPVTEEEVEMFEWCYPIEVELPESLKNCDFLFDEQRIDKALGICRGAKCTIENCKVCKNEMY